MPRELRVIHASDGHRVVDAAGHVLATTPGRQAALERAIHELHTSGGGTVTVVDRSGTAGQPIPVDGVRVPVPPAAHPTAHPAEGAEQKAAREEEGKKLAEKGAELADQFLRRKEESGPLPESISGIKIKAKEGSELARVNAHVSAAAAWIAYVSFVTGSGLISPFVSAAINASEGSATVGAYTSVGMVVFNSAVLCASVAWAVWAVLQGRAKGWGAVAAWVVGTTVLAEFLHAAGFAGPTGSDILTAVSTYPGNPLGWLAGVFTAFVNAYGLAAVVTGIGVGAIGGYFVHGQTPRTA
jgi:hypothetical protein